MKTAEHILNLIEPVITDMSFVLWGCDFNQQRNYTTLRVYVDRQNYQGVTLDDCAKVSREVGAILDVENVIHSRYQLEVSSPGVERTLFTLPQFKHYIGEKIKIKLHVAKNGRRQFEAKIEKIENDTIFLKTEDETITVLFLEIQKARLIARTHA